MNQYTIGIDLGTTSTKTVLLETRRGIVAQASREATLFSPHAGFSEADPVQWYTNVVDSIREILAKTGVLADQIVAISASGMVPAVIAVDRNGTPLRRAILQNDARTSEEIMRLADALVDVDLVRLTGSALTQQSVAPTVAWLQKHEPAVWSNTAHIVGSYDWILLTLGAAPHIERNWALESGLYTIAGDLVDAVLDAVELGSEKLPPVLSSGERAGSLSQAAAQLTGLHAGTALIVGGADHVLSAFAAGVETHGDWLVKLGGAGDILVASDEIVVDERLYLDAHPVPGRWLPNGCMAASGSLVRWYQSLVGGEDLATLDVEAASRPAADLLCLPYFLGEKSPLNDPDLRGSFVGLHLGHDRADLYRSVLEAIAFGFRHNVDVFREIGMKLGQPKVTNGGSKSTLWKQIHSEILGMEMTPIVDHPGASLGAAIIGAIGVGALNDWSDSHRFITLGDPVVPDPRNVEIYDEAYAEWRQLGIVLTPISHAIAKRGRR